jgi:hypothetical protein
MNEIDAISVALESIRYSEDKVRNHDYHNGNYNPENHERIYKLRTEQLGRLHDAKMALTALRQKLIKETKNENQD